MLSSLMQNPAKRVLPLALATLAFAACKKEDVYKGPSASLTAGPAVMQTGATASNMTFNIFSTVSWKVSSDQSWVGLSTKKGANDGIITVSVPVNEGDERTANITVIGGSDSAKIAFTQAEGYTTTSADSLTSLASSGGMVNITMETPLAWKVKLTDTTWADLITARSGTGYTMIRVNASRNTTNQARTSSIQIYGPSGNVAKTINLVQKAATIYGSARFGTYNFNLMSVDAINSGSYYQLTGYGQSTNELVEVRVYVDFKPTSTEEFTIGSGTQYVQVTRRTLGGSYIDGSYFGKTGEKIIGTVVGGKVKLSFSNLTEVDYYGDVVPGSTEKLTGSVMAE